LLTLTLILASFTYSTSFAQTPVPSPKSGNTETVFDPFDPFDYYGSDDESATTNDDDKSAQQLIRDAMMLLSGEHLLDARTKLLKAIQKDPTEYRAYYLLSGYYTVHVGHYRLALKYIKRAQELFESKFGPPPYSNQTAQLEHSSILYYLSQIRLNLDNYQGALDILDTYTNLGYYADWYAGSRAWILMKLGRLQEAIKVARLGVLSGAEPGRTLNMLGILLSMNDQRQEALDVFRQAIALEMSLGIEGQPATPLNNAGEVYKEIFDDDKAESTFLRATSLPDGCEHVLPSLNLALLYIDQLKFEAAAAVMDGFQRCVAQFPLRNGEEHIALVNLARARIDLHTGHLDRAISRLEAALQGTQWFGKIGTNQDDLIVAATISLAQALDRKNNILTSYRPVTWKEWYEKEQTMIDNRVRSWWLMRRAREMLIAELKDIEDLTIRNTDSLIEYPTFGEILGGLSRSAVKKKLDEQRTVDTRTPAQPFYNLYEAEASLDWWHRSDALSRLEQVSQAARPKYDELLNVRAILVRMAYLDPRSDRYIDLANRVFGLTVAALRNAGLSFPVHMDTSNAARGLRSAVYHGPFVQTDSSRAQCDLLATSGSDGKHRITLTCKGSRPRTWSAEDSDPNKVVNILSDKVFEEEISNGGNT